MTLFTFNCVLTVMLLLLHMYNNYQTVFPRPISSAKTPPRYDCICNALIRLASFTSSPVTWFTKDPLMYLCKSGGCSYKVDNGHTLPKVSAQWPSLLSYKQCLVWELVYRH